MDINYIVEVAKQYYYLVLVAFLVGILIMYAVLPKGKPGGKRPRPAEAGGQAEVEEVDNIDELIKSVFIEPYHDDDGVIQVEMVDDLNRRKYFTSISEKTAAGIIKEYNTLGEQLNYDGKRAYQLNRFKDENKVERIAPVMRAPMGGLTPGELFNYIQQTPLRILVKECAKDDSKGLGADLLKYLPWLVALGFLAFMFTFGNQ